MKEKKRQGRDEIRGDPRGEVSDDATKSPGDEQDQTQVGQRPGKNGKCLVPLPSHHRDPRCCQRKEHRIRRGRAAEIVRMGRVGRHLIEDGDDLRSKQPDRNRIVAAHGYE
ncbi:MAG: hypothetical protein B6D36_08885 [Planctomycetes bacterium UTPLA1]|nr:MAG: hypothetical protein B6D36_08885 [Planctomycetes bacterium UTPLA1]